MNACSAHGALREPARKMESGPAKPWMSRANSRLECQTRNPLFRALHQSQLAALNNAVSQHRHKPDLPVEARLARLVGKTKRGEVAMPGCARNRVGLNLVALVAAGVLCVAAGAVHAEKRYDAGASDTEIKIGNIMPYSGPASSYGVIGKTEAAFFNMINAEGGINGRKVNFISYDDAYSPPKAIEQARKLVEGDEVLLIFQSLGTPSNSAIMKYMNAKKVPQLFVASGGTKFGDPKNFPWTMGFQPNYQSEGRIYAKYILENFPDSKIAVFWQNDDAGKDQFKGLKDGLGDKLSMIIADKSYEVSDPSIDSQIVALKDSGADIFFSWAAPKGSAQAIRKVGELGWKPKFFLANTATTIASVLKPAGLENSKGIISTSYVKDPTDPRWKDDPGVGRWRAFMDKYYPDGDKANANNAYAYVESQAMVQVLKQCGDNLTRENVMKQAAGLKNFTSDMLLPGISINTSPDDY